MNTTGDKKINEKGMIFSLDAGIAFVITLIGVMLFVTILANNGKGIEEKIQEFEFEEKALLMADSFVKNYDSNNTSRGACIYDTDKKRMLANELSIENINRAQKLQVGKYFLKSINYRTLSTRVEKIIEEKTSQKCLSVKRFVLINDEKAEIIISICEGSKICPTN